VAHQSQLACKVGTLGTPTIRAAGQEAQPSLQPSCVEESDEVRTGTVIELGTESIETWNLQNIQYNHRPSQIRHGDQPPLLRSNRL